MAGLVYRPAGQHPGMESEERESFAAESSGSGGADSAEEAATVDQDLAADQDAEETAAAEQAEEAGERYQAEGDPDQGV